MSIVGDFNINGRTFHYEVVEIHTFEGDEILDDEIEDNIQVADQIFYKAEDEGGETYYRWLGGPFLAIDEIVDAIRDELDAYEGE